ncbi:LysR family transcriptional regulator [Sessilibacter corallicola]|uniref:LysR substrate-binding domain-containing protein n=1 Tax=Sessilibacter corallicola TaxID=2904075 RepID=A0ABQ0ABL2_9GAMM|nr:LysR substrate-binding domain-containing protein [Sessilibacter corallicola]MCE2027994.1 LysR substrate-binding domain-containing protein [Sessilibacter corallicola]
MFRNIPTDLLRTFVTIVEVGGFTAAAEVLGRSQPAISLQLKRLQDLTGQKLLSRNGLQIELNSKGKLMYRYAKQILALNDEALAQFHSTSVNGKIHFGIPSEFATTLLPKIVGRFVRAYPNVTLEVTSALTKELLQEPYKDEFDLILALHLHTKDAGDCLVKEEELVWVGNGREDFDADNPIPLIVAPQGCVYRQRVIQRLTAARSKFRLVYTNPDLTGITTAIEEGLGVTALARSTVPSSLKVLAPVSLLPNLGHVGISLLSPKPDTSEAVGLLHEFVASSLKV